MADPMINIKRFRKWHSDKATEYFLPFINPNTQKLVKSEVCKATGIGYGALKEENGNQQLINEFNEFGDKITQKLAAMDLVALAVPEKNGAKKLDQNATRNAFNARQVAKLEKENLDLLTKIMQLEASLNKAKQVAERNREAIEVISECNGGF